MGRFVCRLVGHDPHWNLIPTPLPGIESLCRMEGWRCRRCGETGWHVRRKVWPWTMWLAERREEAEDA